MDEDDVSTVAIAAAILLGLAGMALALYCGIKLGRKPAREEKEEPASQAPAKQPKVKAAKPRPPRKATLPSHPLLAGEFKGHTDAVLSIDIDSAGKYLTSCSTDRTVRLWLMKSLGDREHKYSRKNVELDHATHIKFGPDGVSLISQLAVAGCLHVFKISKQKGSTPTLSDAAVQFPKENAVIISIGIASTGRFIMTCSEDAFTVWSLKGDVLARVQTKQAPNTCAAVSTCGRFIACAGFTPDVKIWEVEFSKGGDFQQVSRAMELKGHDASVLSLSFSGGTQKMATISKDGTWKLWDIDVRYTLKEDPRLLVTGEVKVQSQALVSLSPDARVAAIAVGPSILLCSTATGFPMEQLTNIHGDTVTSLCWSPNSLLLVSAGGEDRHIRLWHNLPGLRQEAAELRAKIPQASSDAFKRRLQQQLEEAEQRLESLKQT